MLTETEWDIKENCYLSDAQIEQLKDLELQTEFNNILPIEENVQKINALINQGKHIVLISDMYLPEDFIRKLQIYMHSVVVIMIKIPKKQKIFMPQFKINFIMLLQAKQQQK